MEEAADLSSREAVDIHHLKHKLREGVEGTEGTALCWEPHNTAHELRMISKAEGIERVKLHPMIKTLQRKSNCIYRGREEHCSIQH